MEDIVDLCARWELQPISHIADAFKHQVGPVVSRGQLAGGPVSDAGGGTVMKAQPSPIANLQNDIAMTLVVVLLHSRLSGEKTVPYLLQENIPLLELLVQGSHTSHAGLVRSHGRRRAAIDDFEWCRP